MPARARRRVLQARDRRPSRRRATRSPGDGGRSGTRGRARVSPCLRRYQFGDVFGGGTSGSGVVATSTLGSSSSTCSASASPNSSSSPSTCCARMPNARAERDEVGGDEVDAVAVGARHVLVVAQHPVAAVVDDHERQRDPLLRDRRQLAGRVEEAAVAGDRHHRPAVRERGAERGRERVAERAPAERDLQLARVRRACGSRPASSRGCTCRRRRSPSSGTAKWIASRNRSARASSAPQASARTPCRRVGERRRACAAATRSASRAQACAASLSEHDVGAVVLGRVARGRG